MKYYLSLIFFAILIAVILVKIQIPIIKKLNFGQPIREEGNKEHLKKAGTPTMGGVGIVLAFLIVTIFRVKFDASVIFVLLSTLLFGAIGFIDDFEKVAKKTSLGLTETQKLILQFGVSFVLLTIFYFVLKVNIGDLIIPLFNVKISLGIFSIIVLTIIMVGSVNAVNFTDGLDGLLSGVSIPVFLGIFFIARVEQPNVAALALIFAGALLGFLVFNSKPASIFMGDLGSMAIGGAIVAMLIVLNRPIYYAIIGGVYLVEALSVIIQRAYYKKTKKRVFLMSPIHHHYELKGHQETKIVAAFTTVSILLSILTVLLV